MPNAFAKRLVPVDSDPAPGAGITITVRDERNVLKQAHVWVETLDGKLLAEGQTSDDGRFTGDVPDAALAGGVSVTAFASGHSAVSFLENVAHRVTLELPLNLPDTYATMSGKLTGFKDSDDDSQASLGLVAKAMELTDLVELDSSSFISPLKDEIDVFGKREIPSNIVLPDQTFPVYFIPVHVDKPTYRLPLLAGSSNRYFGVTGTLNVQDAVNAIRNSSAWDLVNLLQFSKAGLTAPIGVPASGGTIAQDVVADTEIRDTVRLRPGRNTTAGDSKRLAVALWEPQPGLFVPSDVKLVQDTDVTLSTVETRSAKLLDVLVTEKGDHFRGAWVNTAQAAMPDAGLSADVVFNGLESTWMIRGGETAQLVIAHVEANEKTSIGGSRFADRWVLVGPRKTQLRLPQVALHALRSDLGTIDHISVDLLQMGHGSYPFITGDSSASDLSALEKVRKQIQ